MHAENHKPSAKLTSLEAFLLSRKNKSREALDLLGDSNDPEIIRRKLGILIDTRQYEEGVAFLKTLPIHERWCDRAIFIYVKYGELDTAKKLIEWAKDRDDELLKNRCRLFYVEAFYSECWKDRKEGGLIFPNTLTEKETSILNDCLSVLRPIIAKVIAEEKISNEIESNSVQFFIEILYLLNDIQEIGLLCELLSTRSPLPIKLAQFALSQKWLISKDKAESLATRYLDEYPELFEAQINSALLFSVIAGDHPKAFSILKSAEALLKKDHHKEDLCKASYQVAQHLGPDSLNEVINLCSRHLGEEHHLSLLVQGDFYMRNENYPKAGDALNKCRNEEDSNWLQVYAEYLYRTGNHPESLRYRIKACEIMPVPELRRSTAQIAFEAENYDKALELLLKELENTRDDISLLNNIAATYFRKGDYKQAAVYYERLKELAPDNYMYYLNLAACYTQLGEPEKAILVYDVLCEKKDAPLEPFLARAFLLKLTNPTKAYNSIISLKDHYWDNLQYLQTLLDLSYKAGKEDCAYEVFLKLRELQRDGKVPKEVLEAKTFDELLDHVKHWNEKVKILNQHLVQGKFPWTLANKIQNHSLYMGWYIRTQPIGWYIEEPLVRAANCIYSTNCFTVYEQPDKTTCLDYIKCSEKGSDVVVDISALITLHQFVLFDSLKKYFGNLYISTDYARLLLQDLGRLSDLQLSRKIAAETIDKDIKAGRIHILDDIGSVNKRPMPFIHEHTLPENEEEHYYRLIDMVSVAYDLGKLDEDLFNRLKQISHKESGIDSVHPSLQKSQPVLVDLLTLQSICQMDSEARTLLPFLETFKIYISRQDQIRNSNDLFHIIKQEEIKCRNDALLKTIRDDNYFTKRPHIKRGDNDDDFLASVFLASDEKLPLLTDDRVLQVLAFNGNKPVKYPAFGTDRLLLKLYENEIIDLNTLSDTYRKLMEWRYRFIIPTHEILFHYAEKFKGNPPGDDLKKTALYLHDCMRDPGLFGGQEQTTRKETMALKLLLSWIHEIASFLVEIWASPDYDEESTKTLTEWVYNEFIPSLPKYTGERGIAVSERIEEGLLLQCISGAFLHKNMEKAVNGFYYLADCMNLEENQYQKIICELIDGYDF